MIPPFLARRSPASTLPPATGREQVRQRIEATRFYQALDLQASVQAWQPARPVPHLAPERATRQDSHQAYVRRQHYETALHQQGLLNSGQKATSGVGVDYATSCLNAAVQPLRGGSASAIKRSKDPNSVWLHRQRRRYLNAMTRSTDGFKASGEAASNLLEDQLKAAYAADQQL